MKESTLEDNALYSTHLFEDDATTRMTITIKGATDKPWFYWIGKMKVAVDHYFLFTQDLRSELMKQIRDMRDLESIKQTRPPEPKPRKRRTWSLFLLGLLLALLVGLSVPAFAETRVTPYASAGVMHRDPSMTHWRLRGDEIGSDTPGTLGAGVIVEGCGPWCLGARQTKLGWFHRSYLDRGVPFNNKPETWADSFGVEFTWRFERFSFSF